MAGIRGKRAGHPEKLVRAILDDNLVEASWQVEVPRCIALRLLQFCKCVVLWPGPCSAGRQRYMDGEKLYRIRSG